jgi:hypothetical protein
VSTEEDKFKHSKRLLKDDNAIKKQVKIAKQGSTNNSGFTDSDLIIKQSHRLAKRHAMDCGNPQCYLCGNPRNHGEVTQQEKRMMQDIEHVRNTRSNGASNDEDF